MATPAEHETAPEQAGPDHEHGDRGTRRARRLRAVDDLVRGSPTGERIRGRRIRLRLPGVQREVARHLGREPRASEVAEAMGLDLEEAVELMDAARTYGTLSQDVSNSGDEGQDDTMSRTVDYADPVLEGLVDRRALKASLGRLPQRERRIVVLRFFGHRTQDQIAADMGLSQSHVARLLSQSLKRLRSDLLV